MDKIELMWILGILTNICLIIWLSLCNRCLRDILDYVEENEEDEEGEK